MEPVRRRQPDGHDQLGQPPAQHTGESAEVAAPAGAQSADDGELAALRESELIGPISTVDGMETTIGQVTAVLAMQAVISRTTGSYGASGSDGVVPLG